MGNLPTPPFTKFSIWESGISLQFKGFVRTLDWLFPQFLLKRVAEMLRRWLIGPLSLPFVRAVPDEVTISSEGIALKCWGWYFCCCCGVEDNVEDNDNAGERWWLNWVPTFCSVSWWCIAEWFTPVPLVPKPLDWQPLPAPDTLPRLWFWWCEYKFFLLLEKKTSKLVFWHKGYYVFDLFRFIVQFKHYS